MQRAGLAREDADTIGAQETPPHQCSEEKTGGRPCLAADPTLPTLTPAAELEPRGPSGQLMTREGVGSRRRRVKRGSGQRPGGGAQGGAHRPASPAPPPFASGGGTGCSFAPVPPPPLSLSPRSPPPHPPRPTPAPCLTPSHPRPGRAASLGCSGRHTTAPSRAARVASRMEGAVGFRGQTYSPQTPARSPGEVLGDPSLQFPVSPPTSTLLDPKERFPGTRSAFSDPGQDRQKQSRRARSPGRGLACVVISRLRGRGGPSDYNLILLPLPTPQVELRRRSSRWRGWRETTPPKTSLFPRQPEAGLETSGL